eukprot:jgi/Botrbrau1/1366/Bobra.0063s0075.1
MHLLGNDAAMGAIPAGKITDAAGPLDPVLVSMLVDALADGHRVEILEDWRALVEALMDDSSCEQRGAAATTNLAFLLCDSLARACTAAGGVKAGTARGKASAAAAAAARQDATLALLKPLPRLLRKFQTESATVAPLASLVRNLKLEVYSLKREEKEVEALLEMLSELAVKLRHPAAIRECLASLHFCASEGPDSLKGKGQAAWRQLGAEIAAKAEEAVEELLALSDSDLAEAAGEAEDEVCEESHAAWAALLRVHYYLLSSPFPAAAASVSKSIDRVLQDTARGRDVPAAVLEEAILAKQFLLLWALKEAEEKGPASPSSPAKLSPAHEVGQAVRAFVEQLDGMLMNSESERVRDAAFTVLCELILVFDSRKLRAVGMQEAGFGPHRCAGGEPVGAVRGHPGSGPYLRPGGGRPRGGRPCRGLPPRGCPSQSPHRRQSPRCLPGSAALGDVAAGVLSHLAGHDRRVCDVARDLHRRLKSGHTARLPVFFLAALQVACLRTQAAGFSDSAMEQFQEVCVRMAAMQSPPAPVPPGSLLTLQSRCLDFILEDLPGRLPCCGGLALMVPRLSPEDADAVLKKAQEEVAPLRRGSQDGRWQAFQELLTALQERASRGRAGPVAGAATPASLPTHRRKSAPAPRTGRNSDSEMSDAEEIEEPDEEEDGTPRYAEQAQRPRQDTGWTRRKGGGGAATVVASLATNSLGASKQGPAHLMKKQRPAMWTMRKRTRKAWTTCFQKSNCHVRGRMQGKMALQGKKGLCSVCIQTRRAQNRLMRTQRMMTCLLVDISPPCNLRLMTARQLEHP